MPYRTLNKRQREAVSHFCGPMLVLAGPGSGKTTVIVQRVKYLLGKKEVPPENILVITYTKAAADEMSHRFSKMAVPKGRGVTFCTFHSLFFKILRNFHDYKIESIIKDDERWNFLTSAIKECEIDVNDIDEYVKGFFSDVSMMKSELKNINDFIPGNTEISDFKIMYKKYEEYKERHKKIDFDDMLSSCYELLINEPKVARSWQSRYKFILIDEFQDINLAQYECIKILAQPENNLFVVGDDDQSIYKFRGARPEFLLDFSKNYSDSITVTLDVNYRSTDYIIKLAQRVINNNKTRFEKEIVGTERLGAITSFFSADDANDEGKMIAQKIKKYNDEGTDFNEMAIIYRTNLQAGVFAKSLMENGIPYWLKDSVGSVYDHWIAKDICAYLRLAIDESDNEAFKRIVNRPKRYVSHEVMDGLSKKEGAMIKNIFYSPGLKEWQTEGVSILREQLVQLRKRNSYNAIRFIRGVIGYDDYLDEYSRFKKCSKTGLFEISQEIMSVANGYNDYSDFMVHLEGLANDVKKNKKTKKPDNAVTLTTMHSSKGLEFDTVFVPSVVDGMVPYARADEAVNIEEERRLFYVAVTRAKNRLIISEIKTRYEKDTEMSPFLKELGLKRKVES